MKSIAELDGRLLAIFDGHCGLCNRAVRWFLRSDRGDRLRFAAFDSPKVAKLLARHGIDVAELEAEPSTLFVVQDAGGPAESLLVRSEATLALLDALPQPWPAAVSRLRWIPRPVLDAGYRLVACWRYRIWGRLENCPLPTAEERARFL